MPGSPLAPPYRGTTAGVVLLVTLVAFEALAVSTAMPVLAVDLDAVRDYGLAFSLFLTASLVGVVVSGSWCDSRGPLWPVRIGLACFTGGVLVCGLAGSFGVLLAGRAVAGAGGGLLIVALYVVIADVYPSDLQPRVFSLLSAGWVLPGLIGPVFAGWLAENVSWRSVFLLVPPLAVPAALALLPRVRADSAPRRPQSRGGTAGARPAEVAPAGDGSAGVGSAGVGSAVDGSAVDGSAGDGSAGDGLAGVGSAGVGTVGDGTQGDGAEGDGSAGVGAAGEGSDGDGSAGIGREGDGTEGDGAARDEVRAVRRVLAGVGLAAGVLALQWGLGTLARSSGPRWATAAVAVVAGLVLAGLAFHRLIPAGTLVLRRGLPVVVLLRGLYAATFFGVEAFIPLMLVTERGMSAVEAGLVLTGGTLGWTVGSFLQARPNLRLPRHLLLVCGAALIGVAEVLLVLAVRPPVPSWAALGFWSVAALGMGLGMSSTSVLVLRYSEPGQEGRNSSSLQLSDSFGGALGIGLAGAAFATWHRPGQDAALFTGMWLAFGALALAAAAIGLRARPASRSAPVRIVIPGAGGPDRDPNRS